MASKETYFLLKKNKDSQEKKSVEKDFMIKQKEKLKKNIKIFKDDYLEKEKNKTIPNQIK